MIIIPWKNYFARKGWNTHEWAKARKIESYTQCVSRIKKMKLTSPTEEEYKTHFCKPVFDHRGGSEDVTPVSGTVDPENIVPKVVEKVVVVAPEPVVEEVPPAPAEPVAKEKPVKKAAATTGTDSILQNLKKSPKKTRASKKKSTTRKTTRSTKKSKE